MTNRVEATSDDFDNMLHALGRTRDALGWRNHYCTEVGSPTAQRFEALGWWTRYKIINDGTTALYRVNAAGKAALKAYFGAHRLDEFAEMVRQVDEGPNKGE